MANNTVVYGSGIPTMGVIPITITVTPIVAHRFILSTGANYCGSGTPASDLSAGVSINAVTAAQITNGQNTTNLAVAGIALVECAGALGAYVQIQVDSVGRATTYSSGIVRGKLLAAALGAGDVVPCLLNPVG